MAIVNFKQGEDVKIELEIFDAGSAVDISAATNIKALLKIGSSLQSKFAFVTETGFGVLNKVTGAGNEHKIELIVERAASVSFVTGSYKVIVLADFADTDFGDNIQVREFEFPANGTILIGEGTGETIP